MENKINFQFQQFVFNSMLFFLVFICYCNSFLMSFEFILTFSKNQGILMIGKFLFIVFMILQFMYPNVANNIISIFLSESVQNYCKKIEIFYENCKNKYPLLTFFTWYMYACIFVLYWFTFFFTEIDFWVTLFYSLFNLIKIIFFPVVITTYILVNSRFLMSPLTDVLDLYKRKEELFTIGKEFSAGTKGYFNKFPKIAILLGTGTVATMGLSAHGFATKTAIRQTIEDPQIAKMTLDYYKHLSHLDGAPELFRATNQLLRETKKNAISIGFDDLVKKVTGKPTLGTNFDSLMSNTEEFYVKNASALNGKNLSIADEFISQAETLVLDNLKKEKASSLSDTTVSQSISPPTVSDEIVVSTAVAVKPEIPSCLEAFLYSF